VRESVKRKLTPSLGSSRATLGLEIDSAAQGDNGLKSEPSLSGK
jgi:hypothetical protein